MTKKEYTCQHPCEIHVVVKEGGHLILNWMTSSDQNENRLVGSDDAEYAAFDASVKFQRDHLIIEGGDSPGGGGAKTRIVVKIPLKLVTMKFD